MRTDLLLRLADLLEADAANPTGVKFDLSSWAQDAWFSTPEAENAVWFDTLAKHYDIDTKAIPVDCNTAACAMGLAAISGAFKDEGLTWGMVSLYEEGKGRLIPVFGEAEGFEAACSLFGIDCDTANQLFDPNYYIEKKGAAAELEVVARLRALVAGTWSPSVDTDDDDND